MRITLLSLFILFSSSTFAQKQDSTFVFSGYIFSEDSVPFENVHLINYRNLKIVTTNSNGYFKIHVQIGDSLKTNHISLEPIIVHANRNRATKNQYFTGFKSYMISPVTSNEYKREIENLSKNMKHISFSIVKDLDKQPSQIDSAGNVYNRDRVSAGLDLLGIFKLFKKRRYK